MGGALSLHPQQLRAPRWAAPLTPGGCGGRPGQGSAFLLELQLNHLQLGSPFLGEGGRGNHKKKKQDGGCLPASFLSLQLWGRSFVMC